MSVVSISANVFQNWLLLPGHEELAGGFWKTNILNKQFSYGSWWILHLSLPCGSPLFFPPDTLACDIQRRSSNLILTGLSGTVTNFWRGSRGSWWHDSTRKRWRNYGGERKRKSCHFLIFLDSSFTFKAAKQFVMSFFSVFVNFLALTCAVEYYKTSKQCFQLVIFAVISLFSK